MNMRKFPVLLTIIMTLFLNACSKSTVNTPENMAKAAARAIIENDIKAFEKLIINREVAIVMYSGLIKAAKSSNIHKQRIPLMMQTLSTIKADTNNPLTRIQAKIKASFIKLNSDARRDGVDLSKATFDKVADIGSEQHLNRIKYDIYFTLSYKDSKYIVRLDSVVKVVNRLYLLNRIKWKGKLK